MQGEGKRPGPRLWLGGQWGAAAGVGGRCVNLREGTRACPSTPRLQPYVSQAATLCIPGCNPMSPVSTGLRVHDRLGVGQLIEAG